MEGRPGIGHNGPPSAGAGWRRYAWGRARRDLMGGHIPLAIVKMRVKRAEELGFSYPHYASILMGAGRDIVGFLFTVDGLHLKLRRRLEMPEPVREKVAGLSRCDRLAFAPSGEAPEPFRLELSEVAGIPFAAAAPEPEPEPPLTWSAARAAIRAALDPVKLPGNAVVMIGTREVEAEWAAAGNLARFVPSERYFGAG
ncbi:MAG: hypothetical protein AAGE18_15610 [Pseudomonadota bacterium]